MRVMVYPHRHRTGTILYGDEASSWQYEAVHLGWTRGPSVGEWAGDGFTGYPAELLERLGAEVLEAEAARAAAERAARRASWTPERRAANAEATRERWRRTREEERS